MEERSVLLSELNSQIDKASIFIKPDLNNAFSKQYSWDIIIRYYEKEKRPYSCIFGDFNKLNIINNKYGHDVGTKAMQDSLNLIQDILPANALTLRLGGDEFCFVLPNCTVDDCTPFTEEISKSLKEHSKSIYGLSIELASEDSSNGSLKEILDLASHEVSKRKAYRNEHDSPTQIIEDSFLALKAPNNTSDEQKQNWAKINNHINVITYNFLQTLRPSSNLDFTAEQIKDISSFLLPAISSLLKEKLNEHTASNDIASPVTGQNGNISESKNATNNLNSIIDPDTAKLIHMLLTDRENVNLDILSDDAIKQLSKKLNILTQDLTHDKSSGFLNKSYFKLYLANEISSAKKPLYAFYITIPGIKLSNSAYGYDTTDFRKDHTNSLFLKSFCKDLNYNNTSFNFSPDDIQIISYGAGDILIICPDELKEKVGTNIDKSVSILNSRYDDQDPYGTFPLAFAPKKEKNKIAHTEEFPKSTLNQTSVDTVITSIKYLNDAADCNKYIFKKDFFKNIDSLDAFKKMVSPLLDNYLNNISDAIDISNLSILITNFYRSFLNYEVLHNQTKNNIIGHYNPNKKENIETNDDDLSH